MARSFYTGFAWQHATADSISVTGTGVTYDTSTPRTGPACIKIIAASGANNYFTASGAGSTAFPAISVQVTARPATTKRVLFGGSAGTNGIHFRLNPNGTLAVHNGASLLATSTTALTDTTKWYRLQVKNNGAAVAIGDVIAKIDNEDILSPSVFTPTGVGFPDIGAHDTIADTYTVRFADLVHDDTTFPGDGKVVLLLPTSDNAVGSGWTNSAGTGTSLFDCVNNTPPIGVADTTANAGKQIRNASANSNYVASMATYSAGGLVTGDTINSIRSMVMVGAPVVTGAKTGAQQITANPAEGAAHAFTGGTSAATNYWSGVAAGTYPTGWHLESGPVVTAPSVTLGTAPTLSLNITGGTASRIAMCCAMGIYVEYTPGLSNITTSLAHGRSGSVAGTVSVSVDSAITQGRAGSADGTVSNAVVSSCAQGRTGSVTGTVVTPSVDITSSVTQGRGSASTLTVAADLSSALSQGRSGSVTGTVSNALASALTQGRSGSTTLITAADMISALTQGRSGAITAIVASDLVSALTQGRSGSTTVVVANDVVSALTQGRSGATTGTVASDLVSSLTQGRSGIVVVTVSNALVSALTHDRPGIVAATVSNALASALAQGRQSTTDAVVSLSLDSALIQGRQSATVVAAASDVMSALTHERTSLTQLLTDINVISDVMQGRTSTTEGAVLVSAMSALAQTRASATELQAQADLANTLTQVRSGVIDATALSSLVSALTHERSSVTVASVDDGLIDVISTSIQGRSGVTSLEALVSISSDLVQGRTSATIASVANAIASLVTHLRSGVVVLTTGVETTSVSAQGRQSTTVVQSGIQIMSVGNVSPAGVTIVAIVTDPVLLFVGELRPIELPHQLRDLTPETELKLVPTPMQLIPINIAAILHAIEYPFALRSVPIAPVVSRRFSGD